MELADIPNWYYTIDVNRRIAVIERDRLKPGTTFGGDANWWQTLRPNARKSKELDGRFTGKLGGDAGGIPVLPGFDETAVLDTDDGGPGELRDFIGGDVFTFRKPVNAGQIAFGEGENRGNFEIDKNGT